MPTRLARVCAPHFVAGCIWQRGEYGWRCVDAAPILHWVIGKDAHYFKRYCQRKGWHVQSIQ